MASNSYYQWLVINSLNQLWLYQNLVFILVVNYHSQNVSLLLRDKLSNLLGGLVSVHLRHVAVHENDAVKPPIFYPELLGQLHRFFAGDDAVNPLVIDCHNVVWHLYLIYLFGVWRILVNKAKVQQWLDLVHTLEFQNNFQSHDVDLLVIHDQNFLIQERIVNFVSKAETLEGLFLIKDRWRAKHIRMVLHSTCRELLIVCSIREKIRSTILFNFFLVYFQMHRNLLRLSQRQII